MDQQEVDVEVICLVGAFMVMEQDHLVQQVALAEREGEEAAEEERRRRAAARQQAAWTRPWIQRRRALGWYDTLMVELEREDPREFRCMMRMDPAMFHELEGRLHDRLKKRDTNWRPALPPGLKLAITLYYFSSGVPYSTLQYGFRVAANTISLIIAEVCQAIIDEFRDEMIKCPCTPEEWKAKAEEFGKMWNFWHGLGALDGKHCGMKSPPKSGSLYHNYKGFFSIILMALVDARYRFMWVEIGANGACSDAQIFNSSHLKRCIEDGSIGFPPAENLPGDDQPMPFFLIGDDAFALRTTMMKPYSKRGMTHKERIFNYRCSRARRVVENAFGILAQRFTCLLNKLRQEADTAQNIVMSCVILHNLMRTRYPGEQDAMLDREDDHHNMNPGEWRDGRQLPDLLQNNGNNRDTRAAKNQRDYLTEYYSSEAGAVAWQEKMV